MVQAVILSSLMAACVALCLLLVIHLRRTHESNRPDGLDGVRETLQEPAPTLPTAGAAVATPPAITVPAQLKDVPPAPVAVQNRPRNNGFTRFGRAAAVHHRDPASARR